MIQLALQYVVFGYSSHPDSKCLSVGETELLLASTTVGSPSVNDG